MIKVLKLKIVCPVNMNWNVLDEQLKNTNKTLYLIKNKTITMYHTLKNKELRWNNEHPTDRVNKHKLEKWYGFKTYDSIIAKNLIPEFNKSGIYNRILRDAIKESIKEYDKIFKEILKGNKDIPSFKQNQPIPVSNQRIKLIDARHISFPIFSKDKMKSLGLNVNKGQPIVKFKTNNKYTKHVIKSILNGQYIIRDSHIQIDKKSIYINLVYKDTQVKQVAVDKNKILGLDLGISKAVTMQVDDTKKHDYIDGGEIEAFRQRINKQRRQKQNQLKYCSDNRHGHGRKTLLKPLKNLEHKIENFKNLTNHRYSKYIVDYAIKNGCGTIQMEDLTGISSHDSFLKTWSYYDLQEKIKYKAQEYGIDVIMINPKHTSQRCHHCGYISKDNRKTQEQFKCVNCGHTTNADLNASRNIAMKDIEKIIETQLESQKKSIEKQHA